MLFGTTWCIDHRDEIPRCTESSSVRLCSTASEWENQIKETWQNRIEPGLPLEFHVVHPPLLLPQVVAHVLLVQIPLASIASHLVTIFDSFTGSRPEDFIRLAIITELQIGHQHVRTACGYLQDPAQVPCQVWVENHLLHPDQHWPAPSGRNLACRFNRQVVTLLESQHEDFGLAFLQTATRDGKRQKPFVLLPLAVGSY